MPEDDTPSPLVKALAATDPADLVQSVLDRLEALALQHDALRVLTLDVLKSTTACQCHDCREASGQMLVNLALVERDQMRLELAAELVDGITAYETPDGHSLHQAIRNNRHCSAVDRLERALDAPPALEGS